MAHLLSVIYDIHLWPVNGITSRHVVLPGVIVTAKFEDGTTIRSSVMAHFVWLERYEVTWSSTSTSWLWNAIVCLTPLWQLTECLLLTHRIARALFVRSTGVPGLAGLERWWWRSPVDRLSPARAQQTEATRPCLAEFHYPSWMSIQEAALKRRRDEDGVAVAWPWTPIY